jgi:hypothetical protein
MELRFRMLLFVVIFGCASSVPAQEGLGWEEKGKPVYHIAFVQAKPGKERAYRKFAREVFLPMWIEAVKAGVVESWTAYEHPVYFGPGVGYTHVLILKTKKGFATFDTLIPDLLPIAARLFPGRDIQAEAEAVMEIVRSDVLYEFASTAEAEVKPTTVEKQR